MKIVALTRLRKQQELFNQTTSYIWEMNRMIRRLTRFVAQTEPENMPVEIRGHATEHHYLVAVLTADEGFSATALHAVMEKTKQLVAYLQEHQKKISLFCIGAKGADFLKKTFPQLPLHTLKKQPFSQTNVYATGERFACGLIENFWEKNFDTCLLVYNHFDNFIQQHPTIEQVLPIHLFAHENPWDFLIQKETPYTKKDVLGQSKIALKKSLFLQVMGASLTPLTPLQPQELGPGPRPLDAYDYEPSALEILKDQLPAYLGAYLTRVLIESAISDNAARLLSMDNATKNAEEILDHLNLQYRRTRQDDITTQIIGNT